LKSHAVREDGAGMPGVSGDEYVSGPPTSGARAKLPGVVPCPPVEGSSAPCTGSTKRLSADGLIKSVSCLVDAESIIPPGMARTRCTLPPRGYKNVAPEGRTERDQAGASSGSARLLRTAEAHANRTRNTRSAIANGFQMTGIPPANQ